MITVRRSPKSSAGANWAADAEGITGDALMKFVNDDLFPGLKELKGGTPRHQLIRSTFEDAYNYMKSGTSAASHQQAQRRH